jgi:simple sugar transport system permease protein
LQGSGMTELFRDVVLVSILAGMVRAATPILFAAIGELITQRAGIWNMGVEGTMLTGAFVAYVAVTMTGSLGASVLLAILAGAVMSLIVAFMTVTLRLDHFVTGLGLNLLASGLTLFWFRSYTEGREPPTFAGFQRVAVPGLADIPFVGPILFQQHWLTYVAFALVPLVWFLLFRTKYGLEIRCLGENPKVLDTKGVGVEIRQYLAVVFGGCMTGLGGAFLMLALSDRFLPEVAAGRGWLAIVAIIAGNWMPGRTLLAVLGFALFESVATHSQAIGVQIPYQFLLMMPYIVSIVAVVIFRTRSGQPAALGVPYHRA